MKVHAVDPVNPAAVPVAGLVPEVPTGGRVEHPWRELCKSIVYYGLLAFGILFPVLGAVYAKFFG